MGFETIVLEMGKASWIDYHDRFPMGFETANKADSHKFFKSLS